MKKGKGRTLIPYLFIGPAAVFLVVFITYPLLHSLYLSFTEFNFIYDERPAFVGLANYIRLFAVDDRFKAALKNTMRFALLYFVLVVVGSLLIAVLLISRLRWRDFFQMAVVMPIIVPLSLAGVMFTWIMNPTFGIFNFVMKEYLGMPGMARNWLGNPRTALYVLVLVSLWKFMGFTTIIFLAGLGSIPRDIYEAARIDGANWVQELIWVTIPNLKEAFFLASLYGIIQGIKVYELPYVVTGGGPGTATLTLYLYIWRAAFGYFDMGLASSVAYVTSALILMCSGLMLMVTGERGRQVDAQKAL